MVTIQCGDKTFVNVEAIIFDKDGTLADAASFLQSLGQKRSRLIDAQVPGVQEPLLMAFGLDGAQLNPMGLLAVGSRHENEIAAAAYVAETGRDWIASLHLVHAAFIEADSYLKRKADHTPLFPGVTEMLHKLSLAGLKLGILSSDTTENVQDFVQKYNLANHLALQMGVTQGLAKPDPAFFHLACQQLGVAPAATLMVGDSTADLEMADKAGARGCIAATWGWDGLNLKSADAVIAHCDHLQIVESGS